MYTPPDPSERFEEFIVTCSTHNPKGTSSKVEGYITTIKYKLRTCDRFERLIVNCGLCTTLGTPDKFEGHVITCNMYYQRFFWQGTSKGICDSLEKFIVIYSLYTSRGTSDKFEGYVVICVL